MLSICCADGFFVRGDLDGLFEGDLAPVGAPVLKGDPEGTSVLVGDPVFKGDPEGTSVVLEGDPEGTSVFLMGDPEGTSVLVGPPVVGCLDKGVGESVGIFVGFAVGSCVTTRGEQL